MSPQEQTEIVEGCYELLLILADAVAQAVPGEDLRHQAERGLQILERAARLRPGSTRAYHRLRADCLARAGDPEGETRERAEATRLRQTTALDHYLDGQEHYKREAWNAAARDFDAVLQLQPDHFG